MARNKSVLTEAAQVDRAIQLIKLGARLQILESETDISYERLTRLYKEVAGKSPAKGQLPFSTDWFLTWQPNIQSSLYYNIYSYITKTSDVEDIDAIIKAFELYQMQMQSINLEPVLSITRVWRMVKFMQNNMLGFTKCSRCGGHFVSEPYETAKNFVCGLCEPPARAGRGMAVTKRELASV